MKNHLPQGCTHFVSALAAHLAAAVSQTCGASWTIEMADPQSEPLPELAAPMLYRILFGEGLRGSCYLAFASGDVVRLTGRGAAGASLPTEGEALAEALRELVDALVAAIPGGLSTHHGPVTALAEPWTAPAETWAFAMELQGRTADGETVVLLVHGDDELLAALAAAEASAHGETGSPDRANLDLVMDVELNCTLRFGQRQLSLREILELASGAVVELDRQVEEPVELILDGKVIARGEAVIIDGNYGLRVTQVVHTVAC